MYNVESMCRIQYQDSVTYFYNVARIFVQGYIPIMRMNVY